MAWKFSVLVVANVTAASEELIQALMERTERGACGFALLVPAPAAGKVGREAAERTLAAALERLRGEGLEVDGLVGDPDPIAAVHDIWDPMKFDEVVISTLPTGASKWLQVDLPHRVQKLTGVQVIHVVSEPPRPEVRTEPAKEPESYGVLSPLAALSGKRPERVPRRDS
jgi:hypothetical protein